MAGLPCAAAARTLSRVRTIAIPASAIRDLFDRNRPFARAVATELSRASCRMVMDLRSLKSPTALERLLDWMLRADAQSGGSGRFKLPFGKGTLASLLGMTPESLSRGLHCLADYGVTVRGRDVTLTGRSALARAASLTPVKNAQPNAVIGVTATIQQCGQGGEAGTRS